MKKRTIWIISAVMASCFLVLLYLQVMYIREVLRMSSEQFDQLVDSSLFGVVGDIDANEAGQYLDAARRQMEAGNSPKVVSNDVGQTGDTVRAESGLSDFQLKTMKKRPSDVSKVLNVKSGKDYLRVDTMVDLENVDTRRDMQNYLKTAYVYQETMLKRIIFSMLATASEKPLKERLNFKVLENSLDRRLRDNGINLLYHVTVNTVNGEEIYRCSDYTDKGTEHTYTKVLFPYGNTANRGYMQIHFPDRSKYLFNAVRFMVPSLIFTVILLITFIFTIYIIFRQKKLSEIKNDFVNNMTHEFKTPISTISLAAQMLNDPAVAKSPTMFTHISTVINDETKRLRFQVEKVLQLSMFDRNGGNMNRREVDANHLIEGVTNTFNLKVEKYGGDIKTNLGAENSRIYADEMHFTNVIFNLMDNAVKYRRPDTDLELTVNTWNADDKLYISIADNGIGIKKEDVKKIFEKFYRVHTGNLHDVKGFGLGLAYVKKIIDMHKGTIRAESELGTGTKFIITLPILKN